jgi:hypothetical protein
VLANPFQAGTGMGIQPGEEIVMQQSGGDQFRAILTVTQLQDPGGVGGWEKGQRVGH